MPYAMTSDLPPAVRRLPLRAREIFLGAFNSAWQSYADRGPQQQEEIAFRVAWAAVKGAIANKERSGSRSTGKADYRRQSRPRT